MRSFCNIVGVALFTTTHAAAYVDTRYPYTGPNVPIGDWVDPTINGDGKGFPRIVEPPAVKPSSSNPTNNINVISLSYLPNGMNIHYQTPFGLGTSPAVAWGTDSNHLDRMASGKTHSYDRTPPCSLAAVTMCSQYFHEVQLHDLLPDTTYYYQITAANGTTESNVLKFTTAKKPGDSSKFTLAVVNDMGYTNAGGTYRHVLDSIFGEKPLSFVWHGGDLSYADDWSDGFMECTDDWPVCYNGTSSRMPGPAPVPKLYDAPLPEGEVPNQGGPEGGDMSVIYETNWDLWQQWMNNVTTVIPYMVLPGNHETTCAEFDAPHHELSAYLVHNETNSTTAESELNYYSCPASQRNFTAFQNRFRMPGEETNGVSNFWYSFDYGLAHFVSIDTETDFAYSPNAPFVEDNPTGLPTENETYITDSGPFGPIDGSWKDNEAYAQWKWLNNDLASVDRRKTPWVFVMSHRPMYSSQVAGYQKHVRNAFEPLLFKYNVDAYISGHIHWYERLYPLTLDGEIDSSAIKDNYTYYVNEGSSLTHLINGAAGNLESHSTLSDGEKPLNITNVLDYENYGFAKITVHNESAAYWEYIKGEDGSIRDYVWLLKLNDTSNSSAICNTTSVSPNTSYSGLVALSTQMSNVTKPTSISTGTTSQVSNSSSASTSIVSGTPAALSSLGTRNLLTSGVLIIAASAYAIVL